MNSLYSESPRAPATALQRKSTYNLQHCSSASITAINTLPVSSRIAPYKASSTMITTSSSLITTSTSSFSLPESLQNSPFTPRNDPVPVFGASKFGGSHSKKVQSSYHRSLQRHKSRQLQQQQQQQSQLQLQQQQKHQQYQEKETDPSLTSSSSFTFSRLPIAPPHQGVVPSPATPAPTEKKFRSRLGHLRTNSFCLSENLDHLPDFPSPSKINTKLLVSTKSQTTPPQPTQNLLLSPSSLPSYPLTPEFQPGKISSLRKTAIEKRLLFDQKWPGIKTIHQLPTHLGSWQRASCACDMPFTNPQRSHDVPLQGQFAKGNKERLNALGSVNKKFSKLPRYPHNSKTLNEDLPIDNRYHHRQQHIPTSITRSNSQNQNNRMSIHHHVPFDQWTACPVTHVCSICMSDLEDPVTGASTDKQHLVHSQILKYYFVKNTKSQAITPASIPNPKFEPHVVIENMMPLSIPTTFLLYIGAFSSKQTQGWFKSNTNSIPTSTNSNCVKARNNHSSNSVKHGQTSAKKPTSNNIGFLDLSILNASDANALQTRWTRAKQHARLEFMYCDNEEIREKYLCAAYLWRRDQAILSPAIVRRCVSSRLYAEVPIDPQCNKTQNSETTYKNQKMRDWLKSLKSNQNEAYYARELAILLWAADEIFRSDFRALSKLLQDSLEHRTTFKIWLWELVSGSPDDESISVSLTEKDLCCLFRFLKEDCIDPNHVLHDTIQLPESFFKRYAASDYYSCCGITQNDTIHSFVAAFLLDTSVSPGSSDDFSEHTTKKSMISKEEFMLLADALVRAYTYQGERLECLGPYEFRPAFEKRQHVNLKFAFNTFEAKNVSVRIHPRLDQLVGNIGSIASVYAVNNSQYVSNELKIHRILKRNCPKGIAEIQKVIVEADYIAIIYNSFGGGSLLEWGLQKMDHRNRIEAAKLSGSHPTNDSFLMSTWSKKGKDLEQLLAEIIQETTHSDNVERRHPLMTEHEAKSIFYDVLEALAFCHEQGVAHRDISLKNILLTNAGSASLTGFGKAMIFTDNFDIYDLDEIDGRQFSPYVSPEQILNPKSSHGCAGDIWSVGVCLAWVLMGIPPFPQKEINSLYAAILNGKYKVHLKKCVSESAYEFVTLLLKKNAKERPSARQLLNNTWFDDKLSLETLNHDKYHIMASPLWHLEGVDARKMENIVDDILSSGDIHCRKRSISDGDMERILFQCIWAEHDLKFTLQLSCTEPEPSDLLLGNKLFVAIDIKKTYGLTAVYTRACYKIHELLDFKMEADSSGLSPSGSRYSLSSIPAINSDFSLIQAPFPDRTDNDLDDLLFPTVDFEIETIEDPVSTATTIRLASLSNFFSRALSGNDIDRGDHNRAGFAINKGDLKSGFSFSGFSFRGFSFNDSAASHRDKEKKTGQSVPKSNKRVNRSAFSFHDFRISKSEKVEERTNRTSKTRGAFETLRRLSNVKDMLMKTESTAQQRKNNLRETENSEFQETRNSIDDPVVDNGTPCYYRKSSTLGKFRAFLSRGLSFNLNKNSRDYEDDICRTASQMSGDSMMTSSSISGSSGKTNSCQEDTNRGSFGLNLSKCDLTSDGVYEQMLQESSNISTPQAGGMPVTPEIIMIKETIVESKDTATSSSKEQLKGLRKLLFRKVNA